MKRAVGLLTFLLICIVLTGQSTLAPRGGDADHIVDRMEIKSGDLAPFFTTAKPYNRKDITHFAIQYQKQQASLHKTDSLDLYYIYKDNNDWLKVNDPDQEYLDANWEQRRILSRKPFLKQLYKTPANFLELDSKYFNFRVNPVLNWALGKQTDLNGIVFQNTRGFELRGNIDDRIWFYTNIIENQRRFPTHISESIVKFDAVPGSGFYKFYKSNYLDYSDDYDYLNATGYFAAKVTKHIQLKFGHDRHFIGEGHRSLFLSDNSANYFFLQLNTRVWKLNYQNTFMELTRQFENPFNQKQPYPKKYAALHHLNYNIFKNCTIGIFEGIIFDRGSTFELQYLNPIIFYRTVEQSVGSPDNAMLGGNLKYNFLKRFSIYGQLLLDEFFARELFAGNGWWANKYGLQAGFKYIDIAGINHLDMQLEYNRVRPFTYSHRTFDGNYTHFNQPLAHPLGASFEESIAILRYQPIQPLQLEARIVYTNYGVDSLSGPNQGNNIFLSTDDRGGDFDHSIGSGIGNQLLIANFRATYQVRHNVYLDLEYWMRRQTSDLATREYNRNYFGVGLRVNAVRRVLDY